MKAPTRLLPPPLPLRTRTPPARMLRSHSPSRVGANPLKSQPGSRKRPEAGTMGEGDRDSTGEALSRRPWPEPKAGRSPVAASLREGARAVPTEHKARAGQRAALPSARAHPPPDGRRSPSSCQAEAGEAESRSPPSPPVPRVSTRASPAVAFVVCPNSANPALPGQKFGAPPLSGPRHGSDSQPRGDPASSRGPRGSAASAAPEPGIRPSGRVGPTGTHAPPPQRPSAVGEGAAAQGVRPVRGRGWGASPPPTPSTAGPGVSPARRDSRAPTLAARHHPASERARGGEWLGSPRSRPGAPPLTCQLSSQ